MSLNHIPFEVVTVAGFFLGIASAILATLLKPVWEGDTFLERWWGPALMVRFCSVRRAEVRNRLSWSCVVAGRIAFAASGSSLLLDLLIN